MEDIQNTAGDLDIKLTENACFTFYQCRKQTGCLLWFILYILNDQICESLKTDKKNSMNSWNTTSDNTENMQNITCNYDSSDKTTVPAVLLQQQIYSNKEEQDLHTGVIVLYWKLKVEDNITFNTRG